VARLRKLLPISVLVQRVAKIAREPNSYRYRPASERKTYAPPKTSAPHLDVSVGARGGVEGGAGGGVPVPTGMRVIHQNGTQAWVLARDDRVGPRKVGKTTDHYTRPMFLVLTMRGQRVWWRQDRCEVLDHGYVEENARPSGEEAAGGRGLSRLDEVLRMAEDAEQERTMLLKDEGKLKA